MNYNEGYPSDIVALFPQGTNSTMFTNCCEVAICDDQSNCPRCCRPCTCRPAGDNPFGYTLFKWTLIAGGRWKHMLNTATAFEAVKYADDKRLKCVLIMCRNCGTDALREHPPA